MLREQTRSPFSLLLCGVLLVACGGASEAGQALAPEAPEGTLESAMCAGSSVTTLSVDGASTYEGVLAGGGSWAVAWPANGVRLEYQVDGVLQSSEERLGASGGWSFSLSGASCYAHNLVVKAYPMVVDSSGTRTTCWTSSSKSVAYAVADVCKRACVCTGSACGNGSIGAYQGDIFTNVSLSQVQQSFQANPNTGWTCVVPAAVRGSGGPMGCYCAGYCGNGGIGADPNYFDLGLSKPTVDASYGGGKAGNRTGWLCGSWRGSF
jgi:hypothetical protein